MKTGNANRIYDWETDDYIGGDNIIYLRGHLSPIEQKKPRDTKKNGGHDVFWNILYVVACLSVPVILFLH